MRKTQNLKALTILSFGIVVIISLTACGSSTTQNSTSTMTQNTITKVVTNSIVFEDAKFEIGIVTEKEDLVLGLSGTKSLGEDKGLLFDFKEEGLHSIWMKDMNYSLDIIWLDNELEVVHLEENVAPETYPTTFTPTKKARYVLEINAGQAKANGIEVGKVAELEKI